MQPDVIRRAFERKGLFIAPETVEQLALYQRLLEKWQKAINLVGATTLDNIAERHFVDSAQLIRHIPDMEATICDLGSGAGFPGLVLAILGAKNMHLVESDIRKATFLREVSRETGVAVSIHDQRAEDVEIPDIAILTARALAPLTDLLRYMHRMAPNATGLFLKGLQHQEEIEKARKKWVFECESFASESDISGKILKITSLQSK